MEVAKSGIASGSIRDLPPSKRFKFVSTDPGSTPCLPPAKKRVFPPPREAAPAAAVPLCLPAKKRAIVAPPPEDAVPACLPAKKRTYEPLAPDAVTPACLPAKKRPYAPPDSVAWSCVPAKKRVHAPPPREAAAGSVPVSLPFKNRVHGPPPRKDAAGPAPVAMNRVHEPSARKDAAGPVPVCLPTKKRVNAPPPRGDAFGSVPVSLPTNKRVMPPLPPPSVKSDGARLGAIKDLKPQAQGSNKHGAADVNPRLANGDEGGARSKEVNKSEKRINRKEIKELAPVKTSKPRSPNKAEVLEKKPCKVVDARQSKAEIDVNKKGLQATNPKQVAPKEESRNGADEVAREREQCKLELCKKAVEAKQASREEEREQETEEEGDDGVLCAVCGSTDGDPSDPIVFCDGCDLMVHASCYGNPLAQAIPDGDWFCSLCAARKGKPAAASCCLCPAKGGAMKRTTEQGRWAHIACSLLVPEVFFRDPDGRDGVD
ncbi:hypothetical protein PR202_gb20691 [Eleusine coracana subsp. coracana]|uniref:PHD-type domain-containing protein n=1 Tax=Eleusine coracana subsp. coracana TaxID=191504 RepID=A0AAV5FB38_ELECO|nr:hypothetical protein PR202_gb20691 [Eleusine coracana subsp. coracana]